MTISTQFEARNLDAVKDSIAKLGRGVAKAMGTIAKGIGEEIRDVLKIYPSKPPHSTYERTNNLQQGWNVQQRGRVSAVVGNAVPYAPYVQSADQQVGFHKATGWGTDKQAVQEVEQSGIIKDIAEQVISNKIRQAGLD